MLSKWKWKRQRERKKARKGAREKRRAAQARFGKVVVLDVRGPPCPRCRQATEVREHPVLKDKHLRQPFYYTRWYRCRNRQCRTTLIMPEAFKVYADQRVVWDE